jgi:hypothetical protein
LAAKRTAAGAGPRDPPLGAARARDRLEKSLAIFREYGDKPGIAWTLPHLGSVARHQGEHGEARALHEESLAIHRELGDEQGIAAVPDGLAAVAVAQAQPSGRPASSAQWRRFARRSAFR